MRLLELTADSRIRAEADAGQREFEEMFRRARFLNWGPRLNEHHLFKNAESAFAFRLVTNRRVPEHAPFFVYGLWLIREVLPG